MFKYKICRGTGGTGDSVLVDYGARGCSNRKGRHPQILFIFVNLKMIEYSGDWIQTAAGTAVFTLH